MTQPTNVRLITEDRYTADMAGKAPAVHTHVWGDVTGTPSTYPPAAHTHPWGDVTDKPATYPPSAHTHAVADVTGLQSALDGKEPDSWSGSQSAYDALGTKDPERTYYIV